MLNLCIREKMRFSARVMTRVDREGSIYLAVHLKRLFIAQVGSYCKCHSNILTWTQCFVSRLNTRRFQHPHVTPCESD